MLMARQVTVTIDDDLDKKLRFIQAKTIKYTSNHMSYSRVINEILRNYFKNNS